MQSRDLKTKALIWLALFLTAFIAAGLMAYQQQQALQKVRLSVGQSNNVIRQVEVLANLTKDAERGQRGYLLTADENYLKPYLDASANQKIELAKLRGLVFDQPAQVALVFELDQLATKKMAELGSTVEAMRQSKKDEAMRIVATNEGRLLMERISGVIHQLETNEQVRLLKRREYLGAEINRSTLGLLAALALGVGSLGFSCFVINVFLTESERARRNIEISERKAREASMRLEACLDSIGDGIYEVDTKGQLAYINPRGEYLFGYTMAEMLGKNMHNLVHYKMPDGTPRDLETCSMLAAFREGRRVEDDDDFFVRNGGETFAVEYTSSALKVNDIITGAVICFRDVTSRKLIEHQLRENKMLFQELSDNMRDIFWICDAQTLQPLFMSKAFEEIYGAASGSDIFSPTLMKDTTHPDDWEKMKEYIQKRRQTTEPLEFEFRIIRPNGDVRWLWSRSSAILDEHGKAFRFCGISSDITYRKSAEKRVNEFYSTVSHELRTPLTSIRGSLGLLEGGVVGALTPRAAKLVQIARSESDRLIRLINDILDVRKIEAGMLVLHQSKLLASELVSETLANIEGMATEVGVTVVSDIVEDGMLYCDKDRTVQVLTNFLSNAIKFSGSGAKVTVIVEEAMNNMMRITVSDTGPGISPEDLKRLFGMFQQLDSSDSRGRGGTGLGLAISKALVEQHGGKVGVSSILGEGSKFWFDLPKPAGSKRNEELVNTGPGKKVAPDDDTDEEYDEDFDTDKKESSRQQFVALVVSEDPEVGRTFVSQLGNHGFKIEVAKSVADAEEALSKPVLPEAIILDLNGSNGNGLDFFHRLAKDERTKKVPVIVVSAQKKGEEIVGHPMLIDWMQKPVSFDKLTAALDMAHIRRYETAKVLLVDDDPAIRAVVKEQLQGLNIKFLEAGDGPNAIDAIREEKPDLVILDLALPSMTGYDIVEKLKPELGGVQRLLIYTASDLSDEQKESLTLGLTSYLTKSQTSEAMLIDSVRGLLDDCLQCQLPDQ